MPDISGLLIRLAEPSDLDSVIQIRQGAILALAPEQMTVEAATAWARKPRRLERCRASIEAQRLWLGSLEAEPVGWLEVVEAVVDGLYVVPSRWRLGIGSRLMDFAEDVIRKQSFGAARLSAAHDATTFYERRGYRATGPRTPDRGTPMMKALS